MPNKTKLSKYKVNRNIIFPSDNLSSSDNMTIHFKFM